MTKPAPTSSTHRLDGRRIATLADFYREAAATFALPGHFGRNLDALHDCLTTDVKGPIRLAWQHSARSRAALGADYERVAAVLREVAAERKDFAVTFE